MIIKNKNIPGLLRKISKALENNEDLILEEFITTSQDDNLYFTEDEIKLMEEFITCKESEEDVDKYYCKFLCPNRHECNDK